MNKFVALLAALFMVAVVAACGSSGSNTPTVGDRQTSSNTLMSLCTQQQTDALNATVPGDNRAEAIATCNCAVAGMERSLTPAQLADTTGKLQDAVDSGNLGLLPTLYTNATISCSINGTDLDAPPDTNGSTADNGDNTTTDENGDLVTP